MATAFASRLAETRAAEMRGDAVAAALPRSLGRMLGTRLLGTGALLTAARWPFALKLEVLTHWRDTLLRERINLRGFVCFGDTFLHLAARSSATGGEMAVLMQFFVDAGVNPNARDSGGSPVALQLARHADPLVALSTLLRAGADANGSDGFGYTLMHRLAAHPQASALLPAVHRLGGDLLAVTPHGETLLHSVLAERDAPEAVKCLLDAGVSAKACDHMGFSAIEYAVMLGRERSLALLDPPSL